jgi:hypothetical protein
VDGDVLAGEIGEALRPVEEVDTTTVPSLERQTTHLYEVARCHDLRHNDQAVLVYLQMAERLCPRDLQRKGTVRELATVLVGRARPSSAAEVRGFAARVGLLG